MMAIKSNHIIDKYVTQQVSNSPLVIFRIGFGIMMFYSTIRFIYNGWIEEFYIQPKFHFTYYAFDWVKAPPSDVLYFLFGIMLVATIGIALGVFYRISITLFFLLFTYVELIDKTYYLNHYYFVSLIAFLMIWIPAHRRFSIDQILFPKIRSNSCRLIEINILRYMAGIVYVYAGLAKINYSWLIKAMPLKIWLPANAHLPVIGALLKKTWVAYLFSWFGAFYDLTIPFLLTIRQTRWLAYLAVVGFHLMTAWLFPIGIFPYVMIMTSILYFPASDQEKVLNRLEHLLNIRYTGSQLHFFHPLRGILFGVFIFIQLLFPWRYLLYPDSLFWHEEGYRFSWRVMLMEKAGMATFFVTNPENGHRNMIDNTRYLTPLQEKMMTTQPDMMLQYAKMLEEDFMSRGMNDPIVTADSYVTLNGSRSRLFIDRSVDLTKLEDSWQHKEWIMDHE